MPLVEISNGELIDKLTILEIKMHRLTDAKDNAACVLDYNVLKEIAETLPIFQDKLLYYELLNVNEELWDIEDSLRLKERYGEFDQEFTRLARKVYQLNDKRSALKRKIDEMSHSKTREFKKYVSY